MAKTKSDEAAKLHEAKVMALRLEFLLAQKDSEIAELKASVVVATLRQVLGASLDARFDQATMSFVEVPDAK